MRRGVLAASSQRSEAQKQRRLVAAALAGVTLAISLHYARGELADDAFISFRYARNLVEGHGLVFNPGERVEGYTNFLWVVLMAFGLRMGIAAERLAPALGIVFGVATVLITATMGRRDSRSFSPAGLVAASLLALNFFFHLWSAHGLETSLFAFLMTLGVRSDLHSVDSTRSINSAPWYGAATLTRPEGALVFAVSLVASALGNAAGRTFPWRRVGLYLLIVVPFFCWRVAYYGYPLPNTFYVKVGVPGTGLVHGISYVTSFLLDPHSILLLFVLPAIAEARQDPRVRVSIMIVLGYFLIVAIEGGDYFPGFRFLVPVMPVLYLVVGEGICATARSLDVGRWSHPARVLTASVLLALIGWHSVGTLAPAEEEKRGCDFFVQRMKMAAATLLEHMPPSTSIALNPVGAIPYYTRFYTLDMLGLTNEHIAHTSPPNMGSGHAGHEKGDGNYILSRRPDLILIGNVFVADRSLSVPGALASPWKALFRSELEIASRADLSDLYARDALPLADGSHLLFLRRHDFTFRRVKN